MHLNVLQEDFLHYQMLHKNLIVVSPDVGGVVRARALAKRLGDADLAIIDKRRPRANVSEVMHIIGDVSGRTCILRMLFYLVQQCRIYVIQSLMNWL